MVWGGYSGRSTRRLAEMLRDRRADEFWPPAVDTEHLRVGAFIVRFWFRPRRASDSIRVRPHELLTKHEVIPLAADVIVPRLVVRRRLSRGPAGDAGDAGGRRKEKGASVTLAPTVPFPHYGPLTPGLPRGGSPQLADVDAPVAIHVQPLKHRLILFGQLLARQSPVPVLVESHELAGLRLGEAARATDSTTNDSAAATTTASGSAKSTDPAKSRRLLRPHRLVRFRRARRLRPRHLHRAWRVRDRVPVRPASTCRRDWHPGT